MKRLFTSLVILAGLITVLSFKAQAQGPLEIDHLQIDIWPEYDQPMALVIYKITLPASTTLPAQVTLSLPKTVTQAPTVAMQNVDGLLYNLTFTSTTSGDWMKVSFTAPAVTLQVEYYDPGLVTNGSARNFQYVWPGDYKVNDLVMRIQQPIKATDLTIQPTQGLAAAGSDGLTYYGNDVGAVGAGTTFTTKISYTNTGGLTGPQMTNQVSPVSTSPGGLLQGLNLVMLVAIAGLVLVGGGVTWFLIQRRSQAAEPARQRHMTPSQGPARSSVVAESAGGGEAIYCHQCGKRAVGGDVFCRGCGTRLHL